MGIHGMSRGTLVFGVPVPVGKLNGEGKDDLRRQGPEPRSTAKWPVRFGRNSRNRLTCISLYNRHHIKHYRTISFLWFFEFGNMSASFRSICPLSVENYLTRHDILAFAPRIPRLSSAAVAWPAANLCDRPISTSWTTWFFFGGGVWKWRDTMGYH